MAFLTRQPAGSPAWLTASSSRRRQPWRGRWLKAGQPSSEARRAIRPSHISTKATGRPEQWQRAGQGNGLASPSRASERSS